MFKDFLFILTSFLGIFTFTLHAFFWATVILFIVILFKLIIDVVNAALQCAGEANYGDNPNPK